MSKSAEKGKGSSCAEGWNRNNLSHGSEELEPPYVGSQRSSKGRRKVLKWTIMTLNVSVIILTYNEEANIRSCLESVKALPVIYIVNSGSSDRTVDICREYTPHILYHPYTSHADQWQWALDNIPIQTPWVLALDADFVVTSNLLQRLTGDIGHLDDRIAGVYVRHRYRFGGGTIRFGGTKKFWLRLIRYGRAKPDSGDLVDFRFVVDGKVATWSEAVIEYNRNDDDISVWLRKQDKFALRLAVEEELRRAGLHGWSGKATFWGTRDERFAWLRDRWLHFPLFTRAVLYFFYRYILMGGILDGRAGFLYHFLQGFWLRVIVDWKIVELRALSLDTQALRTFARAMFKTRSGSVQEVLAVLRDQTVPLGGDTTPLVHSGGITGMEPAGGGGIPGTGTSSISRR